MEYTYTYRIFPNTKQEILINKTFGSCRFIYNEFLNDFNNNGYISKYDKNNKCNNILKQEYSWLKEVDKFAISNSIYNLDNACKRYMNKLGKNPKFKKKTSLQSYQTNYTNNNIEVLDNCIKLPKLGKVKAKVHRNIEGRIINATVKRYGNNKYKVMILVKKEIKEKEKNSFIVGLDMGITSFVTDNVGNTYDSPKALIKTYEKLGKLQKELSKKKKESNNYKKLQNKINGLYDRCNNIRGDFLHKLSTTIINENLRYSSRRLKCKRNVSREKNSKSTWRYIYIKVYKYARI